MSRALALIVALSAPACGGSTSNAEVRPTSSPPGPAGNTPDLGSYMCFRVDAPATKNMAAGPRALCARSVDDCQLARRTILDSLTAELGPNASIPSTECAPSAHASCMVVTNEQGGASNMCTPDPATCDVLRGRFEHDDKLKAAACIDFPSSRLDLPAVRPIDFRMWCFRDQKSKASSDCEGTQAACEHMVNGLTAKGLVTPRPWGDGSTCAPADKVVCYSQLNRTQEQVKFVCTPSFEECQARASEVRGADFEVVGSCGVVTGNKPW